MAVPVFAQGAGTVSGTVERNDGSGLGGVTVVINETGDVAITGGDGMFRFDAVPAGSYNISFSLGDNVESQAVDVAAGETTEVTQSVDWDVSFAETITVFSASRRVERVVDAPASITVISEADIEKSSSTGQVAKALEFAPGVEVTQSGVYDFNLNTRGFNSSLNRRVQTLIDGQEASVNFLGNTEWGPLSGRMHDMQTIELVRGPSSALYGANAFNGVLNLITKSARDSQGGRVALSAGELSTLKGDLTWAGALGNDFYVKLNGSYTEGDDFAQSRVNSVEYPGVPFEVVPIVDEYDSLNLDLRLEKHFGNNTLTVDAGSYEGSAGIANTGIGRVLLGDVDRTYFRANLAGEHFNILAYTNNRDAPGQRALASGGTLFQDTTQNKIEAQTNWTFADGKVRLVAGASYKEDEVDTANDQGIQTTVNAVKKEDYSAVFAQVDFDINDRVKLVLAGRYDESSLHDSEFSPKGAVVISLNEKNTLRLSYNEAFQVPNFSEFFLDAPTAIPGVGSSLNLAGIEAALCTPFGFNCGFGSPVQVRALGNDDLVVEEIAGFEIGYSAILGNKGYLTIDYYNNELENFITDLSSNPFGSVNPDFGPYTPPAGYPVPDLLLGTLSGALGPLIAFLSNNLDGTPIFALASYTNAGQVDTEGVDIGLNYYINKNWVFDFSYSWFDFEVVEAGLSANDLLPNAPEHKFSTGITYNGENYGVGLKYRWVDDFDWAAGFFVGPVESYDIVDLNANYDVNDRVGLSLAVSNLLDNEHYQIFGGDIITRRAIGTVTFRW